MEGEIITICERIVELMDNVKHDYDKTTKLERENGIDSLALMNILIEIENLYHINMDRYMTEVGKAKNIGDLVTVVKMAIEE